MCILVQYSGMKQLFFVLTAVIAVLLAGCDDGPIPSSNMPVLPELPRHWKEILGEPNWRFEWVGEDGDWQKLDTAPGKDAPDLSLPTEWTSPVLAWPFWPALDLPPGVMRPAGALFPWDGGDRLNLSWRGGVDAVLWKELAAAERATSAAGGRLPWYFDWPRFRELMESENVPAAVREDPWLADWEAIAGKTIQSGFDRRRIVARKFSELSIPYLGGRWTGSSPFAPLLEVSGEDSLVLKVSSSVDTWVSSQGILKCSTSGWVLRSR